MKRSLFVVASMMAMLVQHNAFGGVVADSGGLQTDHYIGAKDTGFTQSDDVIGDSYFKIHGTSLSLTESALTVTINTNFVLDPDRYTAEFGDLFVDFFTAADPYAWDTTGDAATSPYFGLNDNFDDALAGTGTKWSYGIKLTGDVTTVGGNGGVELWALDTADYDAAVEISDDYFQTGDWRDRQEVRVNTDDATNANTTQVAGVSGTWTTDTTNKLLTITLTPDSGDLSSVFGLTADHTSVGYHWAMTCGNDTVENEVAFTSPPPPVTAVPEPSTAAIFGLGVLGFAFVGRRRKSKNA